MPLPSRQPGPGRRRCRNDSAAIQRIRDQVNGVGMIINPIRFYRRWRRANQEAVDEVMLLRRRHGDDAISAARAKLARDDLTSWGRQVMQQAVRMLERSAQ